MKYLKEILIKHNLETKNSGKYDSDSDSDSGSVKIAIKSLSKEITKISKSFTVQEKLLKKCINDLDSNFDAAAKIQETVNEYLQTSKTSEMHLQRIISNSANDKEDLSEYMKTENSSPRNQLAPSLFDEIGEVEITTVPQKHENAILISEANLARINNLKAVLDKLQAEIQLVNKIRKTQLHKNSSFSVYNQGIKGLIQIFHF